MERIKYIVILICAIGLFAVVINLYACNSGNSKVLEYYSTCDDAEAFADIIYSIENNYTFIDANDLEVRENNKKVSCGYFLIWGKKKKEISTTLTDMELLEELMTFYK